MNITGWDIYWITRLDELDMFFTVPAIVACLAGIMGLFVSFVANEQHEVILKKTGKKVAKIALPLGFFCWAMCVFLPSTKEMAAIIVIPKLANSKLVNETIPEEAKELYDLAKGWMKNMAGEEKKGEAK